MGDRGGDWEGGGGGMGQRGRQEVDSKVEMVLFHSYNGKGIMCDTCSNENATNMWNACPA